MEGLLERNTVENVEEEKHNAMISERYRKLLDAVEDQFSAVGVEDAYAATRVVEAPVREETPVVEQVPQVTEYTPSTLASSVFTTEKFERMEAVTPVETNVAPVRAQATKVATEAHYSLTPLAKVAMAVFTLLVVAMLVLIGVNSQIIKNKSIRIKNLEEKKEQLIEQYQELNEYIAELQTEESIIQRATDMGLLD